tara:strand:+ start:258 stop:1283 length:1026 start_codon:yes stop_codon:yes gene_type:complete
MSYQSRSRAKSVSDVFTFEGNGKCCFADGTSSETNYYECIKLKGAFFIDVNAQCPEIGVTGCCCSCSGVESYESNGDSYTFTGGLRVTTKCACEEECGTFQPGISCEEVENEDLFCTRTASDNTSYDVRYPYGCCYPSVNESGEFTGWECANVCTAQDCVNLAPDNLTTFCPNVYYGINCDGTEQVGSGRMCDFVHPVWQGAPVNCDENSCSSEDLCDVGEAVGACCVLNIVTNTVECYQMTENVCAAYNIWDPGNVTTLGCWGGCGVLCEVGICPEPPEPPEGDPQGGGEWTSWCDSVFSDFDIMCTDDGDCPPQLPVCCLSGDGITSYCQQSCGGQGTG